ncbi:membrane insertase COX18 ASCRUDRAFT_74104 [Ascoidea rubescens DSM 1968]|uniref:Mitochondrial inner membrane protein COX18 n=1 Tax=Ascoidea rubescens DSM 1968 TaxID=1344418 RepID=A0A1D2VS94_9ASCO|nr:hypothetical protein ASCRUDRAFT_74104 [Ascoidea rubescens DSM 1968]ODV64492.1 hypothetical protein ASCRUDRAFT_74104 [Ascoidea rubescens DSM 1968]
MNILFRRNVLGNTRTFALSSKNIVKQTATPNHLHNINNSKYPYNNRFQLINKRDFTLITSFAEVLPVLTQSFNNLHAYSGLPWWLFIPASTFVLRTFITLPFSISNRIRLRKQNELKPVINSMVPVFKYKLITEMLLRRKKSEKNLIPQTSLDLVSYEQILLLALTEKRKRSKFLFKKYKCQNWKNLILPTIQIPLWITLSLIIRELSGWKNILSRSTDLVSIEPTLINEGGFLWISDYSLSDPYCVFPIILGLISVTNIEWLSRYVFNNGSGQNSILGVRNSLSNRRLTVFDSITNISRLSVVFMIGISFNAPVLIVLYWICSNIYSLVQNIFLEYFLPIRYQPYNRNWTSNNFKVNDNELNKLQEMINDSKILPLVNKEKLDIDSQLEKFSIEQKQNGKELADLTKN